MLKKRIGIWNLDKKHKELDMLVGLRIALAREAQGKKTTFVIRNREVTLDEIKHYFKRKGVRDPHTLLTGPQACTSNPALSCYTPPSSPCLEVTSAPPNWEDFDETDLDIGELCGQYGGVYGSAIHRASDQTTPSLAQRICAMLPPPADLSRLELLLIGTRECSRVYWHGLNKQLFPPLLSAWVLPNFISYMLRGSVRLLAGHLVMSFCYFNQAFDQIHPILKHRDPMHLLLCLYELAIFFEGEGICKIFSRLCDYIIELSAIDVDCTHPFHKTMVVFREMSSRSRSDSATRMMEYAFENGIASRWIRRIQTYICKLHLALMDLWVSNKCQHGDRVLY